MENVLAITGLGLVTSVGHDVETACANIRCGLKRNISSSVLSTIDMESKENEPVKTYALAGITDGYTGEGLYYRILDKLISNLLNDANLNSSNVLETHFIICLSKLRSLRDHAAEIDTTLLEQYVLKRFSLKDETNLVEVIEQGNVGVILGVELAQKKIEKGECKRVIILSVDSLVGIDEINYFSNEQRINTDENSDGFTPGEAGAGLVVESTLEARRRNAIVQSYVSAIYSTHECTGKEDNQNNFGNSEALAKVVCKSLNSSENVFSCYADLNGENSRAKQWANAIPNISVNCNQNVPSMMFIPAESVGDTGAASGGVSICAATRSFVRGYNLGDNILVWSSSDGGSVASCIVHKPT